MVRFGILTVSDRSFLGQRPDGSGPALQQAIEAAGYIVAQSTIVPDEMPAIQNVLLDWCDHSAVDVILTSGGTGFAVRDITPEATRAILQREAPGIAEAIRAASLQITPHAMLSRGLAGLRGSTLIINLPGSPKAALEGFQVVCGVLPHAVDLLQARPDAESGHTTVR